MTTNAIAGQQIPQPQELDMRQLLLLAGCESAVWVTVDALQHELKSLRKKMDLLLNPNFRQADQLAAAQKQAAAERAEDYRAAELARQERRAIEVQQSLRQEMLDAVTTQYRAVLAKLHTIYWPENPPPTRTVELVRVTVADPLAGGVGGTVFVADSEQVAFRFDGVPYVGSLDGIEEWAHLHGFLVTFHSRTVEV